MILMNAERVYLYEGNEEIYLDLYVINDSRLAPRDGMLVIPGGGYSAVCIDREGEKTALAYLARGVNAYVLNYRCAKEDVFPMHLEYAAVAMKWIKDNASSHNTNPERIFVSGFSAGGAGKRERRSPNYAATWGWCRPSARRRSGNPWRRSWMPRSRRRRAFLFSTSRAAICPRAGRARLWSVFHAGLTRIPRRPRCAWRIPCRTCRRDSTGRYCFRPRTKAACSPTEQEERKNR